MQARPWNAVQHRERLRIYKVGPALPPDHNGKQLELIITQSMKQIKHYLITLLLAIMPVIGLHAQNRVVNFPSGTMTVR